MPAIIREAKLQMKNNKVIDPKLLSSEGLLIYYDLMTQNNADINKGKILDLSGNEINAILAD